MESNYRIYKLSGDGPSLCLEDAYLINTDVFKYQGAKGNFKTYKEAKDWLSGLSVLKGDFLIAEVISKK